MKLCHAAALGLVGWYLMLPPVRPDGSVNANAPSLKGKHRKHTTQPMSAKRRGGWVGYANNMN
jgi:hypothetical protein